MGRPTSSSAWSTAMGSYFIPRDRPTISAGRWMPSSPTTSLADPTMWRWRTPGSLTTSCCAGKSASPEMNRLPCLSVPVLGDILINSYFDPYCPRPEDWPSDTDELAVLYADELNSLLDRLLPLCHFVRRQRPSDCWFDKECRDAKRSTRRLECAYAAANRRAAVVTSSSSSSSP